MSITDRTNSAMHKRAEQLKRWEESETNREPATAKSKSRKIKFSSGCVFLAACTAGDKDEVLNLLEKGADINTVNVDGLTALHQACIDNNMDMVEFLVKHGSDVNRRDNEGWTPLHATSSCGFLSIAKYLIEQGANVAAVNNDGELAIDIAESSKMEDFLKDEIQKRGIDCEEARNEEEVIMLRDAKEWLANKSSLVNQPHPKDGATPLHVACAKGYIDVAKILLQCGADLDAQDVDGWTPLHAAAHWGQKQICQLLADNFADMDAKNYVGQTAFDLADTDTFRYFLEDLRKKQNKDEVISRRQAKKRIELQDRVSDIETPTKVKKIELEIKEANEKHSLNIEKKNKVNAQTIENLKNITPLNETIPQNAPKQIDINVEDPSWRRNFPRPKTDPPSPVKNTDSHGENEVTLRRAHSFQTDKDAYKEEAPNSISTSTSSSTATSPVKTSPSTTPVPNNQQIRRSFVPPVRDEESETQRKAHAKRVRETRRSTQGVTLEEIKSAEQFVKNQNTNNTSIEQSCRVNNGELSTTSSSPNGVTVTATITTAMPTVPAVTNRDHHDEQPAVPQERRPSWRLRVDNGSSKFKLEDATKPAEVPTTPSFIRRTTNNNLNPRPSSAPIETAETTITLPLRRPKTQEEKEQDKENDIRNAQATLATQAAIQRRRRPKRRSTGVVQFDNMEDGEIEKDPAAGGDYNINSTANHESGTEKSSRSRLGSTTDVRNENGEIDYKKLYEEAMVENKRLKDKLKKSDDELRDTKQTLEKLSVASKNSISELEKREKRSMERKLSEMEEELKHLENLKSENQRLKDENGALIRVISKLSK